MVNSNNYSYFGFRMTAFFGEAFKDPGYALFDSPWRLLSNESRCESVLKQQCFNYTTKHTGGPSSAAGLSVKSND